MRQSIRVQLLQKPQRLICRVLERQRRVGRQLLGHIINLGQSGVVEEHPPQVGVHERRVEHEKRGQNEQELPRRSKVSPLALEQRQLGQVAFAAQAYLLQVVAAVPAAQIHGHHGGQVRGAAPTLQQVLVAPTLDQLVRDEKVDGAYDDERNENGDEDVERGDVLLEGLVAAFAAAARRAYVKQRVDVDCERQSGKRRDQDGLVARVYLVARERKVNDEETFD